MAPSLGESYRVAGEGNRRSEAKCFIATIDGNQPQTRGFLIIHKVANKNLDREKQFHYIHTMLTLTTVIFKAAYQAAWQRIAVAEGGFY
jgi:hypothetical protein